MSQQRLSKEAYEALRERIRTTCVKERHHTEYMLLMDHAERICSPQQLAGIGRIVRRLNDEADDYDLYMSQF